MTMTTAEAIRILENIETDIYGRIAIGKAIDAMRAMDAEWKEEAYDEKGSTYTLVKKGEIYTLEDPEGSLIAEFTHYEV